MAVTKVIKKTAEIDGKPIEWNVLSITSFLGGDYQTLELKLSKTEAMLAGMLLASDENVPEKNSRKANGDEQGEFGEKIEVNKNKNFLDD